MDTIKALRKALGSTPRFETGTVVRWTSTNAHRGIAYRYAAIYAGNRWNISGGAGYYGTTAFDTTEFLRDVLGGADADTIEVATVWERI